MRPRSEEVKPSRPRPWVTRPGWTLHVWICAVTAVSVSLVSGCSSNDVSTLVTPPDTTTAASIVVTGVAEPGMASYDTVITSLMREYNIPGGAVGVVKDGKLVFAHGYGYADVASQIPVQPDALFRLASLSKAITAATILHLVEQGALGLDDAAFSYLSDLGPPTGKTEDARLSRITIRQLLQHSGGWDRDATFDPMFESTMIADSLGVAAPASADDVIRYMMGRPLDFDPGTRYAYSNFGYVVLGAIIQRLTGEPYVDYVKAQVLKNMGIQRMAQGHTLLKDSVPGEVRYYAVGGQGLDYPLVQSVFPGQGLVPQAYGGFYMEAMAANGGWVSSTMDLLRFVTSVDGLHNRPQFLADSTIGQMIAQPAGNSTWPPGSAYWYAMGWLVRPSNGDANWWHTGGLPGTTTEMVRAYNGVEWVALFNARAVNDAGFTAALDNGLWTALQSVTSWPTMDLFSQYH